MDEYERMLVGRRRLQEAEEQAERSRRELEALQAHDQELAQAEESERHSLAEFRELLARAGVVAEDREQGWEEYEAGVKKQRQLRALDETIRTDRRERELLRKALSVPGGGGARDRTPAGSPTPNHLTGRGSRARARRPGAAGAPDSGS